MPYEFKATRRVEFSDTDLAGIVHFANFFRYMETVEHAFWRSLGGSVVMTQFDRPLGLPRVHAACDFKRPLRFEDVVELHLLVTELKTRSLSYQIRFRRIEPGPAEEVAVGKLTVVCACKGADGKLQAVPFPAELAAQIEIAPPELLAP
ncbi:MAG TPA: thioesterase family protein [Candidatus Limnocylindria bacterium]|nr:thioesterase family protein [Candidatus Limnocylindria bacterium]